MKHEFFNKRVKKLQKKHNKLIQRRNKKRKVSNGVIDRYKFPVLTANHTPLYWRYDFNFETNPFFMERIGVNAVFNPGAIEMDGKIFLIARVEGVDRKSFFAVAESESPIDGFRFWDYPVVLPETDDPDVNVYDLRLVRHEDGWIYGVFCTERKNPRAPQNDTSSAVAQCGIARTHDLREWERLDDIKTPATQQRDVVLHPEFVDGKYAFYTRPQSDFIEVGNGGGIGWGLSESIEHAEIVEEQIIEPRVYHTIKELKNGLGPAPIKTEQGWLQLAHGVRNTAAGLRYVLYAFLTDLNEPWKVKYRPAGYLLAPQGKERIGDVSNVLFVNGWVARNDGAIFIYYASSDTRCHVASTSVDRLLDYVINTPEDPFRSYACVQQRIELIRRNLEILHGK